LVALFIILIILAVIMLIPLGVDVVCREGEFTVAASAWFYKLRLYPAKKKAEKSEEKTEADAETEDKPQKNFDLGFALDDWLKLIRVALRALGRFKNGVYFGYIYLHAVVSAPDPYDAVIRYNAVNGFVGSIIPFFENGFKVKRKDIYIGLDMNGEKSKAEFEVSASVRLGCVIAVGLAAGFGFLKILIKNRIQRIRERVARNGKQQTERNDAVNDEQHQEPC
jgi:hypothetical protein